MAALATTMPSMNDGITNPFSLRSSLKSFAGTTLESPSGSLPDAPSISATALMSLNALHSTGATDSHSPRKSVPFSSLDVVISPAGLSKVKLSDLIPEDGAASGMYIRAVDNLSLSLARYNAAIIQISSEEVALTRCALDSARLYFKSRAGGGSGNVDWKRSGGYHAAPSKEMYFYRAGRHCSVEDHELAPPCMPETFRCLGKAARIALGAIGRHLKLRSDVFGTLLDDFPLPSGEISASILTATRHHSTSAPKRPSIEESAIVTEVEMGLLMLMAADTPGLQVCDPAGKWYLADHGAGPGDLVLLTGRALHHATAGLRRPSTYRIVPPSATDLPGTSSRCSLAFRLLPRQQASIDCAAIAAAGHPVSDLYQESVQVSAFMEALTQVDASIGNFNSDVALAASSKADVEPSLRSILTDPISGSLLEDAMVAQCGHSFGGASLRRLFETLVCTTCGEGVDVMALVPNLALRGAVAAYRREEAAAQQQAAIRSAKRRREKENAEAPPEGAAPPKRPHKPHVGGAGATVEGGGHQGMLVDGESPRLKGVQFPFSVNDHVLIKGNKRTPEKFVGREAIITSQCLNGWYLVRTLDNGESVRLQYRSLQRSGAGEGAHQSSSAKSGMDAMEAGHGMDDSDDYAVGKQHGDAALGMSSMSPLGFNFPSGENPSSYPAYMTGEGEGDADGDGDGEGDGDGDYSTDRLQQGDIASPPVVSGTFLGQFSKPWSASIYEEGEVGVDEDAGNEDDMKNQMSSPQKGLRQNATLQPITKPRSPARVGKALVNGAPAIATARLVAPPVEREVGGDLLGKVGSGHGGWGKSSEAGMGGKSRPISSFKVRSPVGKSVLGPGVSASRDKLAGRGPISGSGDWREVQKEEPQSAERDGGACEEADLVHRPGKPGAPELGTFSDPAVKDHYLGRYADDMKLETSASGDAPAEGTRGTKRDSMGMRVSWDVKGEEGDFGSSPQSGSASGSSGVMFGASRKPKPGLSTGAAVSSGPVGLRVRSPYKPHKERGGEDRNDSSAVSGGDGRGGAERKPSPSQPATPYSDQPVAVPPKKRDLASLTGKSNHGSTAGRASAGSHVGGGSNAPPRTSTSPRRAQPGSPQQLPMLPARERLQATGPLREGASRDHVFVMPSSSSVSAKDSADLSQQEALPAQRDALQAQMEGGSAAAAWRDMGHDARDPSSSEPIIARRESPSDFLRTDSPSDGHQGEAHLQHSGSRSCSFPDECRQDPWN